MKLPDMPELPKPIDFCRDQDDHLFETYTAEQMRSFFELGYKMGREDAAKVCEELSQHKPFQFASTPADCASAIRRQGEQG
jgi:hypothetical protein